MQKEQHKMKYPKRRKLCKDLSDSSISYHEIHITHKEITKTPKKIYS
jgi:hypothetical protein